MTKKNSLDNVVLEFQNTLDTIISKSTELLRENVKKDVSKKIAEDIDDEDEDSEEVTDIDLGFEDDVTDEENTDTEDETDLDLDGVSDETDDVATDDTLDDLGSEEVTDTDVTDDVPALDGIEGDSEIEVDSDVPVDSELSDVIGDIVDGTQLSDEDLVRVFKDITDETDIQVTKDDDNTVSFSNGAEKYVFKLNENDSRLDFINKLFSDEGTEPEESQENVFELHIEESENETVSAEDVVVETLAQKEEQDVVDNPLDEVLRTHADGHKMVRKPEGFYKYASSRLREGLNESVATNLENQRLIKESTQLKSSVENLLNENKNLTSELGKYHETLILMKEQLDKVALINRKMGYINRLFCEHATTKSEKESILERFDNESITDDKGAKALYKTISNELSTVKSNKINESVNSSAIISEVGTSLLAESEKANNEKNPLNEQLTRMQHLMGVQYKKN